MFRRKKNELEDGKPSSAAVADDLAIPPVKPGAPKPAPSSLATAGRSPTMPVPRPADLPRGDTPRRVGETPSTAGSVPQMRRAETETRKLIVGREISLSGEITACDRLVVEGSVEANLANCRDIDIAESGLFKGSASIDDAEIRGRFEGVLNVRRRLLIRASGRVVGTIRYGQIEIECGGQISGDIQAQPMAEGDERPASGSGTRPAVMAFEETSIAS